MTPPDDNAETQEPISSAKQRDQIRDQLEQVPAGPSLGDLAVAAEALADARKLATDEPAVVADLVPDICRALQLAERASLGKGATVLPGEFTAQCYRDGMVTLAALEPEQLCPDEAADGRVEHILETVQVVLATDGNLRAKSAAVCTIGTLSIVVPERVGDALHAGAVSEQVEWLFSAVDGADRLGRLVRATALLAGHVETMPLVLDVDHSTLSHVAEEINPRGRVWLHVLSCERDCDSPVDPFKLYTELGNEEDPPGICWWLLAGHSADAIPEFTNDGNIENVLQKTNAEDGVSSVSRLSDRFEFEGLTRSTLVSTLQTVLQDDNSDVLEKATDALRNLASGASTSSEIQQEIIQSLQSTLQDDSWAARLSAAGGLLSLVEGELLSQEIQQEIVRTLQIGIKHDNWPIKRKAASTIPKLTHEGFSRKVQQEIIRTLEIALQQDISYVRVHAAEGIAGLAGNQSVSNETRQEAFQTLQTGLQHNNSLVRQSTVEGLAELAGDRTVSNEARQAAIWALDTSLHHNDQNVQVRAAKALADLSDGGLVSGGTQKEIVRTLEIAIAEGSYSVRQGATDALADLTAGTELSVKTQQRAFQVIGIALQDDSSTIRWKAADALVDLADGMAISSETQQEIIQALEKGLENNNWPVRRTAVGVLGALAGKGLVDSKTRQKAIRTLQSAFQHGHLSLQQDDVGALSGLASGMSVTTETRRKTIRTLQSTLQHNNPAVRRKAVNTLKELLRVATITNDLAVDGTVVLINALRDTDQVVKLNAIKGLEIVCEIHPYVFITNQSLLANLKRLLTKETSIEIQLHVLELFSWLGEPVIGSEEGEHDFA
jgi:HEAT repeat protein